MVTTRVLIKGINGRGSGESMMGISSPPTTSDLDGANGLILGC